MFKNCLQKKKMPPGQVEFLLSGLPPLSFLPLFKREKLLLTGTMKFFFRKDV